MLQNTVRLIELLPGDGGRKLVVKLIHRIPGEERRLSLISLRSIKYGELSIFILLEPISLSLHERHFHEY